MKKLTSKEKVLDYINNIETFTWVTDVAENTLCGFKGAPYKSWNRAVSFIQKILDELVQEGKLIKEEYTGCLPGYTKTK